MKSTNTKTDVPWTVAATISNGNGLSEVNVEIRFEKSCSGVNASSSLTETGRGRTLDDAIADYFEGSNGHLPELTLSQAEKAIAQGLITSTINEAKRDFLKV